MGRQALGMYFVISGELFYWKSALHEPNLLQPGGDLSRNL